MPACNASLRPPPSPCARLQLVPPAGERKAEHRERRHAVVGAEREAAGARRNIMAAHARIAIGAVGAAIGRAPQVPALLERCRRRLHGRRLEDRRIGGSELRRQRLVLGRKAAGAAAASAAAVHERVGHEAEEFSHQLERALLPASRGRRRKAGTAHSPAPGREAEYAQEVRRQGAAIVEEIIETVGDVLLVAGEPAGPERTKLCRQVQVHVVADVAEAFVEAGRAVPFRPPLNVPTRPVDVRMV